MYLVILGFPILFPVKISATIFFYQTGELSYVHVACTVSPVECTRVYKCKPQWLEKIIHVEG